jgi:aspartyl-tRNA(Asn)/glutamyl-tRNA(Gln) amidotransferase subunit B
MSSHHAFILTSDKPLADYFEEALKTCSNARNLCNWIIVEFAGRLKDTGENIISIGIRPEHIASLVNLIDKGTITGKIAKSVADDMVDKPGMDPAEIVAANPDYQPLNDQAQIEGFVDQVITNNGQSVADYKDGRDKAFAFLVGQVMKLCKGKASPQLVNDLLKQKIEKL